MDELIRRADALMALKKYEREMEMLGAIDYLGLVLLIEEDIKHISAADPGVTKA